MIEDVTVDCSGHSGHAVVLFSVTTLCLREDKVHWVKLEAKQAGWNVWC